MSIQIDRLDGLSSSTAVKGPCRVATTENITLSDLQTIDGVALADGDRVLVRAQTDAKDNGIYVASTGNWRRSKDFSSNRDVRKGTMVVVTDGDTHESTSWIVTASNPIVFDTTEITFIETIFIYGDEEVKTANYTMSVDDNRQTIVANSAAPITFTLPEAAAAAAAVAGQLWEVRVFNTGAGTLTTDGAGAETINGQASIEIVQFVGATIWTDGTSWRASVYEPGAGTVARTKLQADFKKSVPISAGEYGAVLDGSAADRLLVKEAWEAAVADGVPFIVPNMPGGPLVIQVPEDFATVQEAHNAMLNWIFPGVTPKYADTLQNHEAQILIEISVAAGEYVSSGEGIVWNHPSGNLIKVKGRDAVGLTFASLQSTSYASGVHSVRLRFSTWPATDPVVGRAMRVLLPTGTGHYQALEGGWRISAVDAVNKDITLAVYSRELTSALVMTLTGGTFVYIPTQFRFTNLPASGADVAGFDVFTTLRVEDISISGSASGTNAADVDGIITRDAAKVFLGQHTVVLEWNRCGVWVLDGGYAEVSYSGICGNSIGLNVIQHGHVSGGYVGIQGNSSYNVVVNTGAHATLTNAGFDGCGGVGLAVLAGANAVVSGHANYNDIGVRAGDGGVASINDLTAQNNTTRDAEAVGANATIIATSLANVTNMHPPKNYRDARGNTISSHSGVSATIYTASSAWNPGSIADGAQEELVVPISGVTVGMNVSVRGNISPEGMRLWGVVSSAGNVSVFYTNNTGSARDLGAHTVYITVTGAEG